MDGLVPWRLKLSTAGNQTIKQRSLKRRSNVAFKIKTVDLDQRDQGKIDILHELEDLVDDG